MRKYQYGRIWERGVKGANGLAKEDAEIPLFDEPCF